MVNDRIVRLTASNASPMTLDGTNSYIVFGVDGALVIDPGPGDPAHLDALLGAVGTRGVALRGILVTHGHPDHAPGAVPLHDRTGAPVYAHPRARFPFDIPLADGDEVDIGDVRMRAVDAPGHANDHLVYALEDAGVLFTGDVVVGRGTVVIAPPRGDMRAYVTTLHRLRDRFPDARRIYGGHGPAITDPRAKLEEYIAHRAQRERQLIEALRAGDCTIPDLVGKIYADVAPVLRPAAARQLLAYLIALQREGVVESHALERPPTPQERAILDPDLSALVDPQSRAVAAAELGYGAPADRIDIYALA